MYYLYQKQKIFFYFIHTILTLGKTLINYIVVNSRYGLEINVKKKGVLPIIILLKFHYFFLFKTISEIIGLDFPQLRNRFRVNYIFLSYFNVFRLVVSTQLTEKQALPSVTSFYPGAGWLEREVWDFFGIYFQGNRDLRRLLTDYGFFGYPLRKDFPLTGFTEILFDDCRHQIVYQPVSLTQEFRDFTHVNPWR